MKRIISSFSGNSTKFNVMDKASLLEIYRTSFRTRSAEEAIQRQLRSGLLALMMRVTFRLLLAPALSVAVSVI